MYFPRYYGDARPAESDTEEALPEGEKAETILVVEDDADLRAYVSDLLRDLNYRVCGFKRTSRLCVPKT
jgi:hypothetical protein